MRRGLALLITLFAAWLATFASQAWATSVTLDPSITVTLDGEGVRSDVLVTEDGQHYLDAAPILAALGNEVKFDTTENVLTVRRSQDGVVMALYTDTGLIQANGKDLGHLKTFGEVEEGQLHLTPNALSVLTGLIPKYDEESGIYALKLDPRLQVVTGFDILVEDIPLIDVDPQPRAIGPVMLLPLRPIAEELGHVVTVEGSVVTVRRAQDSAVFSLDLDSGLLSLRDRALGVARDISYVRPDELLVPLEAVETLTGTHIRVDGTNIEVVLDGRLKDIIAPSAEVDETLETMPFTPESLTFSVGPQQVNRADFTFRARSVNGRIRYETPDLPGRGEELEPSWLSLDFAHASGVRGSVGDIFAENRELDSVGARRLKGVTAQKSIGDGRISASIGAPVSGTRRVSEHQTRLDFDGFAAGVRYRDVGGWEAGLAVRHDSLTDDQRAVLSAIKGRHTLVKDVNVSANVDLGVFNGPARDKPVDVTLQTAGRWVASDSVDVSANFAYTGAEFTRSNLEEANRLRELDEDESIVDPLLEDIRKAGSDQASYGLTARYTNDADDGTFRNFAASIDLNEDRTGLFVGESRIQRSAGFRTGAVLGNTGIGVSASARIFEDKADETVMGTTLGAGAYRNFGPVATRFSYSHTDVSDGTSQEVATAVATLKPKTFELTKGATIDVSPTASLAYRDGDTNARAGVLANFSSGSLFGPKNRVRAGFGIVQSLDPTGRHRTQEFFRVSADRRLPIGDNLALGLTYGTDLSGSQRIGLTLQGRYDFNASQRISRTKDGTGVLTGAVFLDANRDGVKQEDETALPGMLVRIAKSRLALRADGGGNFTIQNLPGGTHEVKLVTDNLPLGYALSEDAKTKVSIEDGRITHIDLAVVQRGQIRGFVFIDENGNGEFDRGEDRPADTKLYLRGAGDEVARRTTAFGQFAYDDLPADDYDILYDGQVVATVALADFQNLMGKLPVALSPRRFAEEDTEHTTEPAPPEPAP